MHPADIHPGDNVLLCFMANRLRLPDGANGNVNLSAQLRLPLSARLRILLLHASPICFVGLVPLSSTGYFQTVELSCITVMVAIAAALSVFASGDAQFSRVCLWRFRLSHTLVIRSIGIVPAAEVYRMVSRVREENYSFETSIAAACHLNNLLWFVWLLYCWEAGRFSVWFSLRSYLGLIGFSQLVGALIVVLTGGDAFPAPGGTSTSLVRSNLPAYFALASAMCTSPPVRRRLIELWTAIPLSALSLEEAEPEDSQRRGDETRVSDKRSESDGMVTDSVCERQQTQRTTELDPAANAVMSPDTSLTLSFVPHTLAGSEHMAHR